MKRFIFFILIVSGIMVSGCGEVSAPPDARLEIQPASVTYQDLTGDTCHPFTVSVKNKDNIGIRDVEVYVSGSMAAPRVPARYYLYDNSTCSGSYRESNMRLVTEDYGAAYFSILIPAQINVNNTPVDNKFTDTIEVRSGVLYTSATISVQ